MKASPISAFSKESETKRKVRALATYSLLVAAGLVFGGCAGADQTTVLRPVGPAPTVKRTHRSGSLIVYTAIIQPKINPDTEFYPHTAYAIYDSRHALVETVRNHIGPWDESPFVVPLPAGRYTVHAESEFSGDVVVPVIIQGGKTTVVNLQRGTRGLAGL
jgi:hypothetical protein